MLQEPCHCRAAWLCSWFSAAGFLYPVQFGAFPYFRPAVNAALKVKVEGDESVLLSQFCDSAASLNLMLLLQCLHQFSKENQLTFPRMIT